MSEKILVTGGTGLLGSYLLRCLVGRGQPVRALYRGALPALLSPEEQAAIEWVKGDILDTTLLDEQMHGITMVYHCAGMVSFNPARAGQMRKINVEGTANVVNAAIAASVRKLVHVSSVSAFGRKRNGQTVREDVKWDDDANLSAYGRSKYLAEMEVWRGIAEGLDAVIVNPSIILGVGDWDKGSSAMFKNAFREFPWYTEGSTGLVDAADVAEVMTRLMDSPVTGERYIVSAEDRPYREVFSRMAKAFGKKPPHRKATPFLSGIVWRMEKLKSLFSPNDPLLTKETAETAQTHVSYDNSKLLAVLPGFRFRPLDEVIDDYCSEYLVKMEKNPQ
jgi:nucleoside-diphosphate-sugar epimerase